MKNLAALLLFVFALLSLGMVFQVKSDMQPVRSALDASAPQAKAVDSGAKPSHRGQPGEDDSDEEEEEDLAPVAR